MNLNDLATHDMILRIVYEKAIASPISLEFILKVIEKLPDRNRGIDARLWISWEVLKAMNENKWFGEKVEDETNITINDINGDYLCEARITAYEAEPEDSILVQIKGYTYDSSHFYNSAVRSVPYSEWCKKKGSVIAESTFGEGNEITDIPGKLKK